jgi:cyclomaltodextrinase
MYEPAVVAVQLNLLDSHDTPRFLTMAGGDVASFRLATLIQMTVPGAPSIYYGDEIGLPGAHDPDCRRSFPWERPETWDRDLLAYVSAAAALRHAHAVLRHGAFEVVAAEGMAMAYLRSSDDDAFVVAVNAGTGAVDLDLHLPGVDGKTLTGVPLPGQEGTPPRVPVVDGRATLPLPARAGYVLRVEVASVR